MLCVCCLWFYLLGLMLEFLDDLVGWWFMLAFDWIWCMGLYLICLVCWFLCLGLFYLFMNVMVFCGCLVWVVCCGFLLLRGLRFCMFVG